MMGRRKNCLEDELKSIDEEVEKLRMRIIQLTDRKAQILKKKEETEINNFIVYLKKNNISVQDVMSVLQKNDNLEM